MTTIKLDNELQVQIFLTLYEHPKGLNRTILSDKLEKPRTTVYENLVKIMSKQINGIPYIKFHSKANLFGIGRPITIFYIPKEIRENTIDFKIDSN